MEYSTQKSKLVMPEYGRNVQQMLDYALTIEDREERTRCAHTIVHIMGNFFPYLREVPDFKRKLWDHVAIMTDFKLDIDYPYEVTRRTDLQAKPERVEYRGSKIRYTHYGRILEEMIEKVADMPEGDERQTAIFMIANQMKKSFMSWNKETVDDRKIYDDLRELSNGKINVSDDSFKLVETRDAFPFYVNKKNKKPKKQP